MIAHTYLFLTTPLVKATRNHIGMCSSPDEIIPSHELIVFATIMISWLSTTVDGLKLSVTTVEG